MLAHEGGTDRLTKLRNGIAAELIEDGGAFAPEFHKVSRTQKRQMFGDGGLGEGGFLDEVAHAHLPSLLELEEEAESGWIGQSLETLCHHSEKIVQRKRARVHEREVALLFSFYSYILILACFRVKFGGTENSVTLKSPDHPAEYLSSLSPLERPLNP